MKLDLTGFKKIHADESATTLRHPKGHTIKIDHSALKEGVKKQLHALPMHMEEGGEVLPQQEPSAPQEAPAYQEAPKEMSPEHQSLAESLGYNLGKMGLPQVTAAKLGMEAIGAIKDKLGKVAQGFAEGAGGKPQATSPTAEKLHSAAQSMTPALEYQLPKPEMQPASLPQDQYESPYQAQARMIEKDAAQKRQLFLASQKLTDEVINPERQNFQDDIKSGHIDPNHYIHSMGVGQKIATAIGLIVGGIGGAITRQGNPAMQFLQNAIEKDVEGQKQLYQANLHRFGNAKDALAMTRAMQNDYMATQLQAAAVRAQDPVQRMRAMQAAQQFIQQANGHAQNVATRGAARSVMTPENASLLVAAMIPDPKEQAEASKELQKAQVMSGLREQAMGAFQQLQKERQIGQIANPHAWKRASAALEPLAVEMARDEAGRVNEYELAAFKKVFPAFGDNAQDLHAKMLNLTQILDRKAHFPTLDQHGIPYRFAGTGAPPAPNANVTAAYKLRK